jgi:hypothetical protein
MDGSYNTQDKDEKFMYSFGYKACRGAGLREAVRVALKWILSK